MGAKLAYLLLIGEGRIDRTRFWLGLLIVTLIVIIGNALMRAMGTSMGTFIFSLFFPFVVLTFYYNVFSKRLHDMNRSAGLFFGLLALQFFIMICVMLIFGGADYFAEFSEYNRKDDIDPAVSQAIVTRYQDRIRESLHLIRPLLLLAPLAFTAWVGLTGPKEPNRYGEAP